MELRMRNRELEESWAEWLAPINWQWIGHVTFPTQVSAERAKAGMGWLLNELELEQRCRVCCAWGLENEAKVSGAFVGYHFHFVLVSIAELEESHVKRTWRRLVRTLRDPLDTSIVLSRFDPGQNGLKYIVKMADRPDCEVDTHNLKFYLSSLVDEWQETAASRKIQRRWSKQVVAIKRRLEMTSVAA